MYIFFIIICRNLRGVVGSTNYYSGGTPIEFTHNFTHPLFDRSIAKNDIGILVAISNIGLSSNVKLVSLGYDFVGAGVPTTVTGWGRTSVSYYYMYCCKRDNC